MWVHFVHRHVLGNVVILDEGNSPHPQCARYDMQVPQKALNGRHPGDLHVVPGAPWVGGVSFIQHHHIAKDMPVHEVHPHCRPCRHPLQAPFHGACPW